jgi:hypothetical protein
VAKVERQKRGVALARYEREPSRRIYEQAVVVLASR